ncbi:MAG: hypothetical protein SCM11_13375 [Bacillota bacterium]|nr:hypothetical protein [Bacillota bacterium]
MKKIAFFLMFLTVLRIFAACNLFSDGTTTGPAATATPAATTAVTETNPPTTTPVPSATATPLPTATPSPEPTPTPAPTPTNTPAPTPTPDPFAETPDQAGSGGILFDIYQHKALVDLNGDSTADRIAFSAGSPSSQLQINGTAYPVNLNGPAQCFAITDVDNSDNYLEIVFTEPYAELADSERAYSYFYWWDGSQLFYMGKLMDMKFHGGWRSGFDAADHFDGAGLVMGQARSEHLTDIWYTARYTASGTNRKFKEKYYSAQPIYPVQTLELKEYVVLLKNIDSRYFEPDYSVLWDYASGTSVMDRNHTDDIISFLPQAGETLQVIRIYGPYWFKLQAADGKSGWLKSIDKKVQGYFQVMGYTAYDFFDGILVAG